MTPTMENSGIMPNSGAKSSALASFFNFDTFITARVIKVIYIIGLVLIPLGTIGSSAAMFLFLLFNGGGGAGTIMRGFFQLAVSVVASLLGILLLRIYCEFIMVIFKINENLQIVRNRGGQI